MTDTTTNTETNQDDNAIDVGFERVRETVNTKLRAAAVLIKDATKLAREHVPHSDYQPVLETYDDEGYDQLFDGVNALMSAIDQAGWSASSMSC